MNKKIILMLAFIYVFQTSYGQETYQPSKVIPPSPTAASLGVYGEIPVSYYTGTPNISIPIYEIKTSNHSLPIALSYNASGVRISQDASWVGLGWTLEAGGVITRIIRGIDDVDLDGRGYNQIAALPPSDENNDPYITPENAIESRDYFLHIIQNVKDGDPDIFFYNFGNYSGKFVLGKQIHGSPVLIAEDNNLKIEFIDSGYGSWLITTPDGYKYSFGTVELVEDYSTQSDLSDAQLQGLDFFVRSYNESVSSWYLNYIEAPNGEQINFGYKTYNTTGIQSLSAVGRRHHRYDLLNPIGQDPEYPLSNYYTYPSVSRQVIKDVYLEEIVFKNGRIEFVTGDREDIERETYSNKPQRLSAIRMYNQGNELIKEYQFFSSYFNSHLLGSQYVYSHCRLKLDSIREVGKNNLKKNPYRFTYVDQNNLPSKYTRKVDHWGFYNPLISNPTLAGESQPTLLPPVFVNDTWWGPKNFEGAEREPDKLGNHITKGIISSISYPTGGLSVFKFEPADYYIATPETDTLKHTFTYVYADDFGSNLKDDFVVSTTTTIGFEVNAYPTYAHDEIPDTQSIAYLKNWNDDSIIRSFSISDPKDYLDLAPGHYYIEVDELIDYSNRLEAFTIEITQSHNKTGGGIRIQSIEQYDYNGTKLKSKRFIYTRDGTENGITSGRLIDKPITSYSRSIDVGEGAVKSYGFYLVRASSSLFPIGFGASSAPVCYDKIYVVEGDNGEGGSTAYSYHNYEPSYTDIIPELPYLLDSRNGKLEKVEIFNSAGQCISTEENNYALKSSTLIKGVKIFKPRPQPDGHFFYENGDVKYYDNISEWWVLDSKITKRIVGGQEVIIQENYYFDDSNHKQITSKEIIGSDKNTVTTNYSYPHDFISTAPYDAMVANHIISPTVVTETLKEGVPLQSTRTNYFEWGSGLYAPITVDSKYGSEGYETRLRFDAYDAAGNILSVSKDNDASQSYVWGYNHSYPVVEGENVSVSDLNSKVGQTLSELGYSAGLEDFDNYLATLGLLNTAAQRNSWNTFNELLRAKFGAAEFITTYTYTDLVGMSSMTDANNKTTYYDYDDFGRLKRIWDHNHHLVESYDYHYKE